MTIEKINERLRNIEAIKGDPEMAHIGEDELHQEFIAYVADLGVHLPDLAAKAKLILKTNEIKFARWYA